MGQQLVRSETTALNGPEKAAVLLLALGEELGPNMMQRLDEDEIRDVSRAMSNLGGITPNVVEELVETFNDRFMEGGGSLIGTADTTERLLSRFLPPDRVNDIMGELKGPANRTMWDKVSGVDEKVLAGFLANEYPQTIALVLSKIRPAQSAKVLALLPEDLVTRVVQRMIKMEPVQGEMLEEVERSLRNEFIANYARDKGADSHQLLAEILNHSTKDMFTSILDPLDDDMPESAERIRQLMFTFDDLAQIDNHSLQQVIRAADARQLAMALKGTGEAYQERFFSNMPERNAALLREEMEILGPARMTEVEKARNAVVAVAKRLADNGRIHIERGGEERDGLVE